MIFQFYGGYRGGGMFGNFVYWLDYWGVRDIILPFILIFTIFFAILQKINLFHTRDKDGKEVPGSGKKYNVALALAISLLTIIPHATGAYPAQYDVVNIINDSIPEVALLVIVVVLLLMMLGLGLGEAAYKRRVAGWVAVLAGAVLVMIFLGNLFPFGFLSYIDPSIQALIVILLVFGLVVWFVTSEPFEGDKDKTMIEKLFAKIKE